MMTFHSLLARSRRHWVQGHQTAWPVVEAETGEGLAAQALAPEVSSRALASPTDRSVGAFGVGWRRLASLRGRGPSWGVSGHGMVS